MGGRVDVTILSPVKLGDRALGVGSHPVTDAELQALREAGVVAPDDDLLPEGSTAPSADSAGGAVAAELARAIETIEEKSARIEELQLALDAEQSAHDQTLADLNACRAELAKLASVNTQAGQDAEIGSQTAPETATTPAKALRGKVAKG